MSKSALDNIRRHDCFSVQWLCEPCPIKQALHVNAMFIDYAKCESLKLKTRLVKALLSNVEYDSFYFMLKKLQQKVHLNCTEYDWFGLNAIVGVHHPPPAGPPFSQSKLNWSIGIPYLSRIQSF